MGRILCALEPPHETTGAEPYQMSHYLIIDNHLLSNVIEVLFVLTCLDARTPEPEGTAVFAYRASEEGGGTSERSICITLNLLLLRAHILSLTWRYTPTHLGLEYMHTLAEEVMSSLNKNATSSSVKSSSCLFKYIGQNVKSQVGYIIKNLHGHPKSGQSSAQFSVILEFVVIDTLLVRS